MSEATLGIVERLRYEVRDDVLLRIVYADVAVACFANEESREHVEQVARLLNFKDDRIAELTTERDGLRDDYLRRHKDAVDRMEIIERLQGEVEELRGVLDRLVRDMEFYGLHETPEHNESHALARALLDRGAK